MANSNYINALVLSIENHFKNVEDTLKKCDKLQNAKKEYYQAFNELHSNIDKVEKNKEEFKQKEQKAKEKVDFLQKEIGIICNDYSNLEPLSISIFGEWGSGKTYLLRGIKYEFDKKLEEKKELWDRVYKELYKEEKSSYMEIPIFFNAWRFEKEEHIIIPLFKTMLSQLEKYSKEYDRARFIYEKIKLVAISLVSSLQYSKEALKALIDIFSGDFKNIDNLIKFFNLEEAKKRISKDKKDILLESITKEGLESIYLNIPSWIEKITIYDDVRFIFLIDDIDRCLPENALKMLESIKLFLDIPNCSFVLAIDDDIIERGVEHHYKEYKLQNNNSKELPITGSEYLEKIVQLPFRIPNNDIDDAKEFLTKKFNRFKTIPTNNKDSKEAIEQKDRDNKELLDFFAKATPSNPRKLIRAVTLYESKEYMLNGIKYEPLFLARLTLLELLAPKLYRYIKTKGFLSIFKRVNEWIEKEESLFESTKIEEAIEKLKAQEDREKFKKVYNLIQEVLDSRVEVDLDTILDTREFIKDDSSFIKIHTQFKKPIEKIVIKEQDLPKAYPKNSKTFFERIFSDDKLSWQSAFEDDSNLKDAILDSKAFEEFLQQAKEHFREDKAIDTTWLELVSHHLSKKDFIKLIKELNPIDRLKQ